MLTADTYATNVAIRHIRLSRNTDATAQIVESWFPLVLWLQADFFDTSEAPNVPGVPQYRLHPEAKRIESMGPVSG